ncbi:hypothetical protein [Fournierella sp.]|uniref:hypothetical protein n=1 Tax=Allofournierella sp. TaxID=1940256 RepID=UPI00307A2059
MWFFHAYRSFLAFAAYLMPHKKSNARKQATLSRGRRRAGIVRSWPVPGHCCRGRRAVILLRAVSPRPCVVYLLNTRMGIRYFTLPQRIVPVNVYSLLWYFLQLTLVFLTDFAASAEKFLRELYG